MSYTDFVSKGGQFGSSCLVASATDKEKLCALDTSISTDKLTEIKNQFIAQYMTKMRTPVDKW